MYDSEKVTMWKKSALDVCMRQTLMNHVIYFLQRHLKYIIKKKKSLICILITIIISLIEIFCTNSNKKGYSFSDTRDSIFENDIYNINKTGF